MHAFGFARIEGVKLVKNRKKSSDYFSCLGLVRCHYFESVVSLFINILRIIKAIDD